jgi:D-3-phosphoglycerate dehydrogenase
MQVGRQEIGGNAIMMMQIDSKPSSKIMERIKNHLNELDTQVKDLSYLEI